MKFLDSSGVTYLWQKILAKVAQLFMPLNPESIVGGNYESDGADIGASGYSIAFGYAENGTYSTTISANGQGAIALGYTTGNNVYRDPTILADSDGSVAMGFASCNGVIQATNNGAHAFGTAEGFYEDEEEEIYSEGIISASGVGSMATGYVNGTDGDDTKITASGKGSFAGGYVQAGANNESTGEGSFAYGTNGVGATGNGSMAVGSGAKANDTCAISLGGSTMATAPYAFACGFATSASTNYSYAEGYKTKATSTTYNSNTQTAGADTAGYYSHAEGNVSIACGSSSHAEGKKTLAKGLASHAEGYLTVALGSYSHAEGCQTTSASYSHAEGYMTGANQDYSHAEGYYSYTIAGRGGYGHAEGYRTLVMAESGHSEGRGLEQQIGTITSIVSQSGTFQYVLSAASVTIEGSTYTLQTGDVVKVGSNYALITAISGTTITTDVSLSASTGKAIYLEKGVAYSHRTHSEGYLCNAAGNQAHAEGYLTISLGNHSHAEGVGTKALGEASHAEGSYTRALGPYSHAEGQETLANSTNTHAGGHGTVANTAEMTAIGRYNDTDVGLIGGTYLFTVGNGTSSSNKSNAFSVTTNGATASHMKLAGGPYQGEGDPEDYAGGLLSFGDGTNCYIQEDSNDYMHIFASEGISLDGNGSAVTVPDGNLAVTNGRVNALDGFFQTSDIRKKNVLSVLDLDKAYDLIDKCQSILYTLKDDKENKVQIGMIAQEVQEFFPEIVSESADGTLSLDYARLTVVILRVLKDLIARIKKLELR